MNDELARAAERLRQLRDSIRHERAPFVAMGNGRPALESGALVPGDRVFDPVTGQEGVIEHVARANVIVPATKG